MGRLRIHGPTRLRGEVRVRGGKNAVLPAMVAAACGNAPTVLENAPTTLRDVRVLADALSHLGCGVSLEEGRIVVDGAELSGVEVPPELSGRIRYSLLLLGLLVGRRGHACIYSPRGCEIGERRFDLHLHGLRCLGAQVEVRGDRIEVHADQLVGTDIEFYLPTTTGTETVLLAACFARGRTRIFNANTRPEIVAMGACLRAMGARVTVRNRMVEVEGGPALSGCTHSLLPAWDEALTYIIGAGITGGRVRVRDFDLARCEHEIRLLRAAGMDIVEQDGDVIASGRGPLRPFELFTAPYPGVNSDMQPLFAALACRCSGTSTVTDQRFHDRFQYVAELRKLGLQIDYYGNHAEIVGPLTPRGAAVRALDLRCGAALVLGGLAAEGITDIDNSYQIERGYEFMAERMRALGADIESLP